MRGKLVAKILTGIILILEFNFLCFSPYKCTLRRVPARLNYIEELTTWFPRIAQLVKTNLADDVGVQTRIARIIIEGSPYWHKNGEGKINLRAIETLLALGKAVIGGDIRADGILSAIESLWDSYYLDEILARIASGDKGERRGALAELLNLAYIKHKGVKINGNRYEVEVIACSVSFIRNVTLGKKQFDGLVRLIDKSTGKEKFVVVSSKNKNGLNHHVVNSLIRNFTKDLRDLMKLSSRTHIMDPVLEEIEDFSQLQVLFLLSTYNSSEGDVETALKDLRDWAKENFTSEQKRRCAGLSYCPVSRVFLEFIEDAFPEFIHTLKI